MCKFYNFIYIELFNYLLAILLVIYISYMIEQYAIYAMLTTYI